MSNLCVYEHWRLDKNLPFYVGYGDPKRPYDLVNRNPHHKYTVAKLVRLGVKPEIRIVAKSLTYDEATSLEIELIAFWRSTGVKLTNISNGGDGNNGHRHTEETKKLMSERISEALANPEIKIKISKAAKIREAKRKADVDRDLKIREHQRQAALKKPPTSLKARIRIGAKSRELWTTHEYRNKIAKARAESAEKSSTAIKAAWERRRAKGTDKHSDQHKAAYKATWDRKRAEGTNRHSDELKAKQSVATAAVWERRRADGTDHLSNEHRAAIAASVKAAHARRRAALEAAKAAQLITKGDTTQ
jgi:hypothetical protein